MTQKVSLLLLVFVTISVCNSQIQFEGIIKFLKEMGELRNRLRNVQRTGSALLARADALDAAILKMNIVMDNSIGSTAKDSVYDLQSRLRKSSGLVETTKHNMTKLDQFSNVTKSARRQLNNLAEDKSNVINVAVGKITTLESTVRDLQKLTKVLKAETNKTMDEGESGFGYENSTFPSTRTLRFQRLFSSSPNVLYGMTHLERAQYYTPHSFPGAFSYHRYYYTLTVNITNDNIDDKELKMTMKISSKTTLRDLEFGWMACHI